MFDKVLIANRGEIACRVIRTLQRMGIASVAVYSEADAAAEHVLIADQAICLGPAAPAKSYLDTQKVLEACQQTGAQAIHPGYGFLSENAAFAHECEQAGIAFIGPTPKQIQDFGLKHTARELAEKHGVPLLPGTPLLQSAKQAVIAAESLEYPVILKATAGGGGIGMRVCHNADELKQHFEAVRRLGEQNFADAGIYLEQFITTARHVEVQIFGDGQGNVISLGERDCSLQRRNQKVIEETPAPNLPQHIRQLLCDSAERLASSQHYRSAGTVEFVYDAKREQASFLEVNTRLQVEHGITEQVTGVDLVEWMIRCAAGDSSFLQTYVHKPKGHAIQARVYAEDANKDFQPSAGTLTHVHYPDSARIDGWVEAGTEISPFYDPLLTKVIVTADSRELAIDHMQSALDQTRLDGIETNLAYLRQVTRDQAFITGQVSTKRLAEFNYKPRSIDVISGGNFTTVQDYPGRTGYWGIGVPPSGPMDAHAFNTGNQILSNDIKAAGLEMTAAGPTLTFNTHATICLTGADMQATIDEKTVDRYTAIDIQAGQTLKLGRIKGPGLRSYLLIQGGLDLPEYLGSQSTFTLGEFGGHAGRTLRAGDVLHLNANNQISSTSPKTNTPKTTCPTQLLPQDNPTKSTHWEIEVLEGPHSTDEFFLPEDIHTIFNTNYEVHYNSSRTGVRLIGPKPTWARTDGGEAGLHPSNIHDNAYAIGALDFTGDMPIILGPDGPSLGGFVCPVCIVQQDLWKIGQLAPGDTIRFIQATAKQVAWADESSSSSSSPSSSITPLDAAIVHKLSPSEHAPTITYRRQGDANLLIEYGPLKLDIDLRCRVQAVFLQLRQMTEAGKLTGIIDLTPGIRSLQVHYDQQVLPLTQLLDVLVELEASIPNLDDLEFPSRIVRLPLSYDDPAIHETIDKYIQSVREDAPWCPKDNPSNIEFIRRVNGLDSIDEVQQIVFDATYLVYGLGDVYLGAPVAVPLDPRQRLVTTKYNPARTWTPPNVVGIGGAYLCIYGMEGPGGYQLFGRTVPVWNTYRQTHNFIDQKPWLLRLFDQIQFYSVSHDELMAWRRDVITGQRTLDIQETTFKLKDYHAWLQTIEGQTTAFRHKREAAFEQERQRWVQAGEFEKVAQLTEEKGPEEDDTTINLTGNQILIESPLTANVWQVPCKAGDQLDKQATLAILEAMKMETQVTTPTAGQVVQALCQPGQMVKPGTPLFVIEPASNN